MKKSILIAVAALFVVSMFLVSATAADRERPAPVTGEVKVTKDDKGAVTAVKIGDQAVALDEMGKALAALMADKKTDAMGKPNEAKELVVRRFSAEFVGAVKKAEAGFTVTAGGLTFAAVDKDKKLDAFDGKDALVTGSVGIMGRDETTAKLTVKDAKEAPKKE